MSPAADPAALRAALNDPWGVVVALHLDQGAVPEAGGFKVRCPWCGRGRRAPPCSIRVREGELEVHCFACHQGGDVLALIAQVEGVDPEREASRLQARAAELARVAASAPAPTPAALRAAHPRGKPSLDAAAWDRGARGLLSLCPLGGSAAAELSSQGVLAEALVDGWGELPVNASKQGPERERDAAEGFDVDAPELDEMLAALDARALRAFVPWLWTPAGAIDHPAHRLLIPWRTPERRIWSIERRRLTRPGAQADGEPASVEPIGTVASPAGPHPYGIDAVERGSSDELWLVEGALDVLALRALNRRGFLRRDRQPRPLRVLGLPGVGAWPRLREGLLPLLTGRRVVLALRQSLLDGAAAVTLLSDCTAAGVSITPKAPPGQAHDWLTVVGRGLARGDLTPRPSPWRDEGETDPEEGGFCAISPSSPARPGRERGPGGEVSSRTPSRRALATVDSGVAEALRTGGTWS